MIETKQKHTAAVEAQAIRNLLTLRYDPEIPTFEKKLYLRDFSEIRHNESVSERIESILRNEIRIQVGRAKNVAIPIGSGVDSAVIATLAKEVLPGKNIFGVSLGFEGHQDETADAKKICDTLGIECHVMHIKNVLMDLPFQLKIVREPRWNLWYYYVLKQSRTLGADIMLTGDGGDELFGGYVFRYSKYLKMVEDGSDLPFSVPRSDAKWARRAWAYLQCHDRDWVPDQEKMFGPRISPIFSWYDILRYFRTYFNSAARNDDLNQVFLADYNGKLTYDWIPTNAKLSNHFGIKMSSPFLSDPLIEYAPHIPVRQKYDLETQQGKLILRAILEKHDILKYVGKKKLGFGMDLITLWDRYGAKLSTEYLEDATICEEQLIDRDWLRLSLHRLKKNKDLRYVNKILHLLSLEIWYRVFVSKTLSPSKKLE